MELEHKYQDFLSENTVTIDQRNFLKTEVFELKKLLEQAEQQKEQSIEREDRVSRQNHALKEQNDLCRKELQKNLE